MTDRRQETSDSSTTPSETATAPLAKKARSSLFAAYERRRESAAVSAPPVLTVRNTVIKYLEMVDAGMGTLTWVAVKADKSFDSLQPLQRRVLSVPATSAPVGTHI